MVKNKNKNCAQFHYLKVKTDFTLFFRDRNFLLL